MIRSVRTAGHLILIDYHYPDEADGRDKIEVFDRARELSITRHLSQKEMEAYFQEEGIRVDEIALGRLDVRFDKWMGEAKASAYLFPQLRRAFEALRDQGGI